MASYDETAAATPFGEAVKRRPFVAGMLAVLAIPELTWAQSRSKAIRIGCLVPGLVECPPTIPSRAFRQGLVDFGWLEGRDVILDRRCFATAATAASTLDALLQAKPNVLLASGNPAA